MARPHRRRPLPRPLLCPAHLGLTAAERAAELDRLLAGATGLCAALDESPLLKRRLTAAQRRTLRGRWAAHLPILAERLAAVLDAEPAALAPLALRGEDLRAQEAEVRKLHAIKAMLDAVSERVGDALLQGRGALCSDAQRTLDAIEALIEGPLATPELSRRLETAAEPARVLVARQRAAVRATRQRRKALRSQLPQRSERSETRRAQGEHDEPGAHVDDLPALVAPSQGRLPGQRTRPAG